MKPPRKYASATALRVALEGRLKGLAQEEGLDLQRARRQAAFDRLLCRLFSKPDVPWLLKGGYAIELHAYTLPGVGREDTRVKDLVDLALLIERTSMNAARLMNLIRETFQRRKKHAIPPALASPPTGGNCGSGLPNALRWTQFHPQAMPCGDSGAQRGTRAIWAPILRAVFSGGLGASLGAGFNRRLLLPRSLTRDSLHV